MPSLSQQKIVVVGAGPVGALAALYAARRGDAVEIYELRDGKSFSIYDVFETRKNNGSHTFGDPKKIKTSQNFAPKQAHLPSSFLQYQ